MKIILDLREKPNESDFADLNDLSEQLETCLSYRKHPIKHSSGENEGTHEGTDEDYVPLSASYPRNSPTQSRTPIYDAFMLAAGKELGSEEETLKSPLSRRSFGTQRRMVDNFASAAEELRRDIDSAQEMLEDEEAVAAIEYCRLLPLSNSNEAETGVRGRSGDAPIDEMLSIYRQKRDHEEKRLGRYFESGCDWVGEIPTSRLK